MWLVENVAALDSAKIAAKASHVAAIGTEYEDVTSQANEKISGINDSLGVEMVDDLLQQIDKVEKDLFGFKDGYNTLFKASGYHPFATPSERIDALSRIAVGDQVTETTESFMSWMGW